MLVKIYSGKVTKWNDNNIQSLNPTITLPNESITLAYRSEQSGSTYQITEIFFLTNNIDAYRYIMKQALQNFSTSSNPWGYVVSTDTTWPVKSDLYGKESFDIAIAVETHPYSLGYVFKINLILKITSFPLDTWKQRMQISQICLFAPS